MYVYHNTQLFDKAYSCYVTCCLTCMYIHMDWIAGMDGYY